MLWSLLEYDVEKRNIHREAKTACLVLGKDSSTDLSARLINSDFDACESLCILFCWLQISQNYVTNQFCKSNLHNTSKLTEPNLYNKGNGFSNLQNGLRDKELCN